MANGKWEDGKALIRRQFSIYHFPSTIRPPFFSGLLV
jgi:hypothetical protein